MEEHLKNEDENQVNFEQEENQKIEETENYHILIKELSEYGYSEDNFISQNEINLFLSRKSPKNKFGVSLSEKLFRILNLNEFSVVTISQFISGFLQLGEELIKRREELQEEIKNEKELFDNIIDMCKRYQSEKLNEEGFSENAKLSGEIIESNFNIDLEGIQEIIVKIIYAGQEQAIRKNLKDSEIENEDNKSFEFKASTKKENLQFILMTKNYLNYEAEIGSKTYSLEGIVNQDPFFVKVEIPFEENEVENQENFAAIIKAKLLLRWSESQYYELQKKKKEPKLKKLISDLEEIEDNILKMQSILSKENVEIIKKEGKEKEKHKTKITFSQKTLEFPDNQFVVEYNNERIDNILEKGIRVNFNNEKEPEEDKEEEIQVSQENKENQDNLEKQEYKQSQDIQESQENQENINANNNINLGYDYNDNTNNINDINYNNIDNYVENTDINIVGENNNDNINYEEILKQSGEMEQNEQINLENTVNINPQQNYTSYTDALFTESTKQALVQESTLPLKYLPQKVNKVIIDNNISTLPLIDAGKKITYSTSAENNIF